MWTFIKGIFYLFLFVIFSMVISSLFLLLFVDPNQYKPEIIKKVQQMTGRSFEIQGKLGWTFFPMLGITAEGVELGNPSNFPSGNLASVKNVEMNVAFSPLFHGEIQVGDVKLDGLVLHLIKNAKGETNWQNKTVASHTEVKDDAMISKSSSKMSYFKFAGATISAIEIKNGKIIIDDAVKKQHTVLDKINLKSQNIAVNKAFPFNLEFLLQTSALPKPAMINLQSDIILQSTMNSIRELQSVNFSNLKAKINNLLINGKLDINNLNNNSSLVGDMTIPNFDANNWLSSIGKPIKQNMLHQVSAKFDIAANSNVTQLKNIKARVDQSNIIGNINILSKGNTEGQFNIDSFILDSITAKNIGLIFNTNNGLTKISSLTAQAFGGQLQGVINIDTRNPETSYRTLMNFNNINVNDLISHFKEMTYLEVSGTGNIKADLTTSGKSSDALTKNLNGNINFNIKNGVLNGIDIPYYSNLADALVNKTQPTRSNTKQTPFGNMTGSFQIANGIAKNQDLLINAPQMKVTGNGTANLVTKQLEYQLQLQRLTSGAVAKSRGPEIPILITGPFSDPKIRPDWQSLVVSQAKEQIKEQIQKHSGEIGQQLQQGLQSLLGG
jgi:AsmA protein